MIKLLVTKVGSITDFYLTEKIIAEGRADIVAMARDNIADPQWVNKIRRRKNDEIVPCTRCDNCLDEKNVRSFGGGISGFNAGAVKRNACTVNPRIGIDHVFFKYSLCAFKDYLINRINRLNIYECVKFKQPVLNCVELCVFANYTHQATE